MIVCSQYEKPHSSYELWGGSMWTPPFPPSPLPLLFPLPLPRFLLSLTLLSSQFELIFFTCNQKNPDYHSDCNGNNYLRQLL